MNLTHYDVLGVTRDSCDPALRAAYRAKALRCHPDRCPSSDAGAKEEWTRNFQLLQAAAAVLLDASTRAHYDETLLVATQRPAAIVTPSAIVSVRDFSEAAGYFSLDCRCGGEFKLSSTLIFASRELVRCNCDTCSLIVEVDTCRGMSCQSTT